MSEQMQARDVEVGQSQRQPVILEPLGYRHPSSDSLVSSACLQTNDHSRRLVVPLDILRNTPDKVVCGASLVHILYHSTVTHEQTTHAVTNRIARDNSELTWVSWVRWGREWCGREDSNFHGLLAHSDLNAARLPIPPQPPREIHRLATGAGPGHIANRHACRLYPISRRFNQPLFNRIIAKILS